MSKNSFYFAKKLKLKIMEEKEIKLKIDGLREQQEAALIQLGKLSGDQKTDKQAELKKITLEKQGWRTELFKLRFK
jgi:hypothetical protein